MYRGPERRKRKRYGVKGSTISYKKGLFGSYSDLYLMLNTSETGFMFITREQLPPRKTISCRLQFEELDGTIVAKGKVIWTSKSQQHEAYRTGIQLTKISESQSRQLKAILDNAVGETLQVDTGIFLKEIKKL